MFEKFFKSLVVAVAMALASWLLAPTVSWADHSAPQVGHFAPDFTFKDLDGKEVSLRDFRGQAVFFSPWFSGCPVCQKEMKEWQAFHEAFGDLIKVIGINVADSPEVAREFAKQQGATFTNLLDPRGAFVVQYRITKMPTMFFVDQEGVIREISKATLTAEGMADIFAEKVFGAPILPLTHLETVEKVTKEQAVGELIDTDGDGRPEGARVDLDGDGTFEATVASFKGHVRGTVPNRDVLRVTMRFEAPAAVLVRVDLNNDGNPEIFIEARASDGVVERITVDLDSDGTSELRFPQET